MSQGLFKTKPQNHSSMVEHTSLNEGLTSLDDWNVHTTHFPHNWQNVYENISWSFCFASQPHLLRLMGLMAASLPTWLTISSSDDSKRDLSTSFPMRQYYALPSWDKIKPSVLPHPPGIACLLLFSNAQCTHTSSMSTHPRHNDHLMPKETSAGRR